MSSKDTPELTPTVREFIAAEAVRRGLDFDACRRVLGREMVPEAELGGSHADHDVDHVLAERLDTLDQAVEVRPGFWQERKRLFFEKRGLKLP